MLKCTKPWTDLYMASNNGDVKVCCWSKTIGNINKNSLKELWNSTSIQRLRYDFINGNYDSCPSYCPNLNSKGYIDPYWGGYRSSVKLNSPNAILNNREINLKNVLLKSNPRFLKLYFDSSCNLNCIHCHLKNSPKSQIDYKLVFDNFKELSDSLEGIRIWGGEPLFSKTSLSFLSEVNESYSNIKVDIITNGHFLDKLFLNEYKKLIFGFIQVSLDAASERTYYSIRKNNKFEVIINNITQLKNWFNKNNSNTHLSIDLVLQPANLHEILQFIKLGEQLNVYAKFGILDGNFKWLKSSEIETTIVNVCDAIQYSIKSNNLVSATSLSIIYDELINLKI